MKTFSVLTVIVFGCHGSSLKRSSFTKVLSLSGIFVTSPTPGHFVNDLQECARRCFDSETCSSFTFSTARGICVPFTKLISASEASFPEAGTSSYWKVGCRSNYSFVEGTASCVKIVLDTADFSQADTECMNDGATLLALETLEKHGYVKTFLEEKGLQNRHYWLGASYSDPGGWTWVNGIPVDNSAWCPNEPNDADQGETVIEIVNMFNCTNDLGSGYQLPFICESPFVNF